ncbi:MAG: extracellular solute-binding protein [Desulfurococcaceae archaeon]
MHKKYLNAITKTTSIILVVAIVLVVVGIAIWMLSTPSPAPSPTPVTEHTTTTTPITTPTTPTPTVSPTPTTPVTPVVTIGSVQIRVPEDFREFVEKARRGEVKVTIYFGNALAPEERPGFYKAIDLFKQEFPGIEVRVIEYGGPGDMQSAVVAAASLPKDQRETLVGNAPDVFTWAHDWVGWMADSGYLVALEDYLGYEAIEDISDQIIPSALAAVTYKAKTYGLPYAGESLALFVNLNLVQTLPSTFQDLQKVMEQFYKPAEGKYGISGQVAGMYHINAWVTAFGGFFYNDVTKELGLTKPETISGVKFFVQNVLRYMDVSDLGHDYQRRLFGEGKAPIYISGPWDVRYAIQTIGIDKITVIPFPTIDGRVPKPWSGFRNLYITVMAEAGGKERTYASILFVLYLALNDNCVMTFVNELGYVPVKYSVAEYVHTHLEENKIYKIVYGFYEQLQRSTPMPKDKNMQIVWGADTHLQTIWQEYANALAQGKTVNEAVQAALDKVEVALENAYNDIAPRLSK